MTPCNPYPILIVSLYGHPLLSSIIKGRRWGHKNKRWKGKRHSPQVNSRTHYHQALTVILSLLYIITVLYPFTTL